MPSDDAGGHVEEAFAAQEVRQSFAGIDSAAVEGDFSARKEPEAPGTGGGLDPELNVGEERVDAQGGLGEYGFRPGQFGAERRTGIHDGGPRACCARSGRGTIDVDVRHPHLSSEKGRRCHHLRLYIDPAKHPARGDNHGSAGGLSVRTAKRETAWDRHRHGERAHRYETPLPGRKIKLMRPGRSSGPHSSSMALYPD